MVLIFNIYRCYLSTNTVCNFEFLPFPTKQNIFIFYFCSSYCFHHYRLGQKLAAVTITQLKCSPVFNVPLTVNSIHYLCIQPRSSSQDMGEYAQILRCSVNEWPLAHFPELGLHCLCFFQHFLEILVFQTPIRMAH